MKQKIYRVDGELGEEAHKRRMEYISECKSDVTEAQIVNASIKKGLKELTNEEIKNYVEKKSK